MAVTREPAAEEPTMIIGSIQTFPLRIPFKPGHVAAASVWGPKDLAAVDSLLVKVTTGQGLEGWG
jgi:L-alanine-DL-glutamate epimerase-like enolase superfamily enzyme